MIDCRVTARLLGRWYDHDLPPDEAQTFEEHLLLCPPCLVEAKRLRGALSALQAAAGQAPSQVTITEGDGAADPLEGPTPTPPVSGTATFWKFLRAGGTSPGRKRMIAQTARNDSALSTGSDRNDWSVAAWSSDAPVASSMSTTASPPPPERPSRR